MRALTRQEVAHLLNALVEVTSSANWERVLDRLQPDTRQTLQRLVSPSQAAGQADTTEPPSASLAKLQETWAGLWDDWQEIVIAATEEDGKYIEQEAHWEEPYFDHVTFMEDLEDVAAKMRPLLKTAFENAFSPTSGFAEALDDAVSEVEAALPEWMALHDHFSAGEHLTTCVLTWEWLATMEKEEDAFDFVCTIREWENAVSHCTLQSRTLLHFFSQVSEADQQRVFTGLTENQAASLWKRELENVHSHWRTLYMHAIERYAPERYVDNLRPTIPQQWENGLPVIEACLSREDYHESLAVIEETLASLLRWRSASSPWTPESALLFPIVHGFRGGSENLEPHKSLLHSYLRTAQGLGHTQRGNALELQLTAFDHFFDWQSMFNALDRTEVNEEIRQALFASWQHAVARRAKPYVWRRGLGFGESNEPWWLHWLLESIRDPHKGPDWFRNMLGVWLAALPEKRKTFDDDFAVLRLLTHDVMALHGDIMGRYPRFCDVVLRDDDLSTPDEASRRAYVQQYAPDDVLDQVLTYWQENLQAWVPRPETVEKSDYTQHARWMSALRELAPQVYKGLLAQWQEQHHRRRNLWKAMTHMGLD